MAPDRRHPSISLPAFYPHTTSASTRQHSPVIRHSDTEISRNCTECRGRSDGRGVVFFRESMLCCTVIVFVGVISNAGFMLTDNMIMLTSTIQSSRLQSFVFPALLWSTRAFSSHAPAFARTRIKFISHHVRFCQPTQTEVKQGINAGLL